MAMPTASTWACGEVLGAAPCALAVIALLAKHLSVSLVARHGPEAARALLGKTILDAGAAGDE